MLKWIHKVFSEETFERFAHFSAKNLIEFGLMGEKSQQKVIKCRILLRFLTKISSFSSVLAE